MIFKAIRGDAFWRPLRDWIRADDNLDRLHQIRDQAGATPDQVPTLRVFDIVIWYAERPIRSRGRRDDVDEAPQD